MFKAKMAMAVSGKNKHYLFKDIQRRHFNSMAVKAFDRHAIEAVGQRLPRGFPVRLAAMTKA